LIFWSFLIKQKGHKYFTTAYPAKTGEKLC
jgi:hypothetical protein